MPAEQLGLCLLLLTVAFGIRLGTNFGIQGLFGNQHLLLFQLSLPLGTGNLGIDIGGFQRLGLLLRLDFICSIRFGLFDIGVLLKLSLPDSELVLFLGNLLLGVHPGLVGRLVSLRLLDGNITVGLRLGNGSVFLDAGHVVDTQVVNDAVLVGEGLDVEGNQLQTHLTQVRQGVLLDTLTESLAVSDHFGELHLTNDFTHVAFQGVLNLADNLFFLGIQEVGHGKLHQLIVAANADFDGGVNLDVDILAVGNEIRGLDIHRNHPQGQLIEPLQEGDFDACPPHQNTGLTKTGDNVCYIGRGLDVTGEDENEEKDCHNGNRGEFEGLKNIGHLVPPV